MSSRQVYHQIGTLARNEQQPDDIARLKSEVTMEDTSTLAVIAVLEWQ
jgi:hypothetical protein